MSHVSDSSDKMADLILNGYRHVVESSDWDGEWLSEVAGVPLEKIDEVHRALADLRVIERAEDRGGGWRAVSPRVAMAKLVAPIETEVRRRAIYAEDLRGRLQMLLPIHEAKQGSGSVDAIEVVTDDAALITLIEDETAKCATELMVMQGKADQSASARNRYLDAHNRGAQIRTIFQHAGRYHLPTEGFVDTLHPTGMEFRTVGELPIHVLIFDRATSILVVNDAPGGESEDRSATGDTGVAVVVRHPLVVSLMAGIFEEVWARCSPYNHADPQPTWIGDELRRSILRLLATGAKDDAVARRLGISVRTCRRHVSDLMTVLGVTSRFQAGVEAQKRKLV